MFNANAGFPIILSKTVSLTMNVLLFSPHSCCEYLQKPGPHRLALPSGGAGHSCFPPAWWQCCCQRGPSALSASAPRSRMSDVWRCRTPAEHRLHPGSSCMGHYRQTSISPTQALHFSVKGFCGMARMPMNGLMVNLCGYDSQSHRSGLMVQFITDSTVQAFNWTAQLQYCNLIEMQIISHTSFMKSSIWLFTVIHHADRACNIPAPVSEDNNNDAVIQFYAAL